jgi:hypothetical protein
VRAAGAEASVCPSIVSLSIGTAHSPSRWLCQAKLRDSAAGGQRRKMKDPFRYFDC